MPVSGGQCQHPCGYEERRTGKLGNQPSRLLFYKIRAQRIDFLIEVKDDTPLLPAAADMKAYIPFAVRRVCQLSWLLSVSSPGKGVSYFVVQSLRSDRVSGLARSTYQFGCWCLGISRRVVVCESPQRILTDMRCR